MSVLILLVAIAIMIAAAETFTNAVEWLGDKLKLGASAVGSVLAAVGTALPETLIPIVAIIQGGNAAHEVGVGAILGAPFMLSTLALFVSAIAVFIFRGLRAPANDLLVSKRAVSGDLRWFLVMFAALAAGSMLPEGWPRATLAVVLLIGYGLYVRWTLGVPHQADADLRPLYLQKLVAPKRTGPPLLGAVIVQLTAAVVLLAVAAQLFVSALQTLASGIGIPLLVLSLLIVPVATELPEKFNSVLWLRRRKDTLALGNITGAMVFQTAVPGAIGLVFTGWDFDYHAWTTVVITLIAASIVWLAARFRKRLTAYALLPGGLLYLLYVALALGWLDAFVPSWLRLNDVAMVLP